MNTNIEYAKQLKEVVEAYIDLKTIQALYDGKVVRDFNANDNHNAPSFDNTLQWRIKPSTEYKALDPVSAAKYLGYKVYDEHCEKHSIEMIGLNGAWLKNDKNKTFLYSFEYLKSKFVFSNTNEPLAIKVE